MPTPKILCMGKGTQDVFLRSDEFDPKKVGKKLYTNLPLGLKMEVEDVTFATGGNATNVAATLARQGLDVSYAWGMGSDSASQAVLGELDKYGVDTRFTVEDERYQAGYSVIMIATNGERTILNHKGVSFSPRAGDLPLEAIRHFDWVYPSSLGDTSLNLLRKIVEEAAEHGVKVMLNPAGNEFADIEKLKTILEDVEVLCLNKEEMQKLTPGETLEELAIRGLSLCPVVIVSDGPNGVVATDGQTIVRAGMYEDVPVIDRTGAGDAFASGFLSRHAMGRPLVEAITFASANSTSVVTKIGAKAGILPKSVKLHEMPIYEKALNPRSVV